MGENSRIVDSRLNDSLVGSDVKVHGVSGQVDLGDHSVVVVGGGA